MPDVSQAVARSRVVGSVHVADENAVVRRAAVGDDRIGDLELFAGNPIDEDVNAVRQKLCTDSHRLVREREGERERDTGSSMYTCTES